MTEFVFNPAQKQIENSNIHKLMKRHEINTLEELSSRSVNDLDWFWGSVDEDLGIVWNKKYQKVSDFSDGNAWPKWFLNGKTNIVLSSIDKFSKLSPDKIAYYFISEDGIKSKIDYKELEVQVNRLANGLKKIGVVKGDVVAIYMPMIKEAIIAIMACAKIGAIQTVIFSGYSSESLQIRLQDCNAKILFVSDGFTRKNKPISQKQIIENAILNSSVEKIVVTQYKKIDSYDFGTKFISYSDLVKDQSENCVTSIMDSDDSLFILYTSGTTGKPKGVIHTHGGFSVFAAHQSSYLINMSKNDILFWPADIGWITGLVWNVYGMLLVGGSAIIYDGALDWPDTETVFKILQDYKATIFGISPTAVRLFRKNNVNPLKFNLDSLQNIPTTGEPIDEESWWWLFEKVGKKQIPIMNLSGGTEIGGAMLSVFPGMKLKPSTVGFPCPGIDVDVFDDSGQSVREEKGYLVIKSPWPGMTRGLLNDSTRYLKTYWSRFQNVWFHGDYVFVDKDGLWYMHGRVDDVINVSGHRLSTAEIEQCVVSHDKISEAASISIPDDITGEAIVVFAVVDKKINSTDIESELVQYVSEKIGKIAKPKKVLLISELPKTRTGKILRRLLKAKLLGMPLGDLSSLENPNVLDEIQKLDKK